MYDSLKCHKQHYPVSGEEYTLVEGDWVIWVEDFSTSKKKSTHTSTAQSAL
jgi:hypothetical protein